MLKAALRLFIPIRERLKLKFLVYTLMGMVDTCTLN